MEITVNFRAIKLTFFLFLFFLYGKGQDENYKFGFVIGPTMSLVQNAHNPSTMRYSFYSGVFARLGIGDNYCTDAPIFYIQPQLEYIQAGEKGDLNTLYANNYISLPVFLKIYPIQYNDYGYFFLQAGPRFSYLIKQNIIDPPTWKPYRKDQQGKANNFDFSLSVAGGIAFENKRSELIFRYDYSFSDTYPYLNEFKATGDPKSQARKIQHILSVGYTRVIF